jgi:hypothetical protein
MPKNQPLVKVPSDEHLRSWGRKTEVLSGDKEGNEILEDIAF